MKLSPEIIGYEDSQSGQESEFNTINWRDTSYFVSEDDYRTVCGNVSQC